MALRDSMRASAAKYLQPGEPVKAVFGAQTHSQWMVPLTGFIFFYVINKYRIFAVTPQRIVVLDAGRQGMKKARGVVTELPRSTPSRRREASTSVRIAAGESPLRRLP